MNFYGFLYNFSAARQKIEQKTSSRGLPVYKHAPRRLRKSPCVSVCLKHSFCGLPVYKRRLTAEQTPFGDSTAVAFTFTSFKLGLYCHTPYVPLGLRSAVVRHFAHRQAHKHQYQAYTSA